MMDLQVVPGGQRDGWLRGWARSLLSNFVFVDNQRWAHDPTVANPVREVNDNL